MAQFAQQRMVCDFFVTVIEGFFNDDYDRDGISRHTRVDEEANEKVSHKMSTKIDGWFTEGIRGQVFDEIPDPDVVSWSSTGLTKIVSNCPSNALIAFQQMQTVNERPNSITLVSLLSACTHLHDEETGKSIHSYIIVNDIKIDVSLGTVLFEMYAKSGNIKNALKVFDHMSEKNLQSWTIMISCLANHGCGELSISLFNRMEENGVQPDRLSFAVVLSACSHLGLVYE
ncbi:pentatricopeptide repeat-containing protein At3g26630, chloroplastic-like [Impatiens glandulifera]|uniref:pentatricopeptide repeat-containing protein At3g26630, chloroplastic-like n=1 Tax=Impatiens glandulifera TaxID=253017 RepID=UPI001FB109B7|nr:pentatricopeptide repeat-containing protein At3g26630, chloroplastic-like [Impatiens glandulifera]